MAPVGSFEALAAAINAGADAVYFGLGKLNMRSRSSVNFTFNDLSEIVTRCNKKKIKTYLTLNISLFDNEMDDMKQQLEAAREQGVSAVIASDQAVIAYAREIGLEVHLSTQVNISNIEAVKFYSHYADVMVLARELNMDQVHHIYRQIQQQQICGPSGKKVSIEMFAHGALCMSVSGKCYLSLHEQNHSANRGACLQHCRKAYSVTEKETGMELEIDNEYIMSPKDLKTIHFLNKLIDAGVRILKIEGRARSPEYVKTVIECYNEALLALESGSYNQHSIEQWNQRLSGVFNRGFWNGYYLGQRLGEWSHVYGSTAKQVKQYVAKCTNYFTRLKVAEFYAEAGDINVGDKIYIIGPTTGVIESEISELRVDLKNVNKANKGMKFSVPVPDKIRRADKLYKLVTKQGNSTQF